MARPDDSSDDTTSSPHQTAPFVSYNDTTFNNQTPLSHNSASSSSNTAQNFDSSSHANDEDEGLDEEEDRQSDEGSEEEPGFNDMEYVKEVVSNSWGLNVTKIKCPVCQDTIAQSEWTRYVDQSTLTQYNQYNQPYRSFSRFCNQCDHELVISHVNRSALGLPARELQPFFDCLLEELRSLLILAGLNIDDTGTHPHDASKQCLTSHDIFARQIVQSFTDDYKSFCEISQESQLSLPSKAQSYLSNIAYRTLGAPFISPTPPPNLASSGSSNHPPSLPQQSYQSLPNSSSAVPRVHTIQSKASPNSADEHIHQHSNTAFQRKQYSIKTNGVIEIYKPLMISLLGLLDLQSKDKTDELWPSYSDYAKAIGSMDSISNDGNENVLHHYAIEKLEVAIDTKDINIDDIPSGTKRKGISTQGPSKSKRTRPARSRILTRSEKKRRSEIKKALSMFSKQLTSIETRPEQWKELQFLHVRWLRWEWCESCSQELCLQCGESSHHESQVCFDYMRSLTTENDKSLDLQKKKSAKATGLQSPSVWSPTNSSRKGKDRSDLDANTIQWKLANTNPCPNCCILIHRDDGCNKVDCMLCGYRFCWICREAWGSACGFFNCGRKPTIPDPHNTVESAKINEGVQDRNTVNVRANMDDEGNIQSLAVSRELLMGTSQVDASLDLSQQDFHGRRSPEDAASEKPEIGVPNVFVIHTKRSRA
ncbi:hypothetical protein BGZ46_001663 [Entomortierella lignicola]|nr:hypothetical protein BGZ46_001663 [Entomortierella lignicola]